MTVFRKTNFNMIHSSLSVRFGALSPLFFLSRRLLHQLGLVFPDLVLLVLPLVICHLHIPKHRVIDDELQHQLLFCDAEVAGILLGPFLLLFPLVISQAGGGGDINRHR